MDFLPNEEEAWKLASSLNYSSCAHMHTHLLDSLLVVYSLPLELFAGLARVSQLSFVQITATSGSGQILLQLPDGHLHLFQLSVVLLHATDDHTHSDNLVIAFDMCEHNNKKQTGPAERFHSKRAEMC